MKQIVASIALAIVASLPAPASARPAEPAPTYALLQLSGSVNPVIADHLVAAIGRAARAGRGFIVLEVDTPGGFMDAMSDIIKAINASPVPVVAYTAPRGARAASAGGYIMLAAHVAAMAPGTEMGAMHPVGTGLDFLLKDRDGSPAGALEKKVLNDAIAQARSLAQLRRRNADWAERAVSRAQSSTYQEALALGVIDLVAEDRADLLRRLDGRRVVMGDRTVVIRSARAVAVADEMDWKQRVMNKIADPNVVFLLLVLAVAGIALEFKSPGMIVPGALGAVCLLLFLMALRIMPVNVLGILFLALGITLLVLELKFTSYGLLTLGGIAAFAAGGFLLFDAPRTGGGVSPLVIGSTLAVLLAFVFLVVRAVMAAHRGAVTTGMEGLVGETGTAFEDFSGGAGRVRVRGELWEARCDEDLRAGDPVAVTGSRDLVLSVRRASAP